MSRVEQAGKLMPQLMRRPVLDRAQTGQGLWGEAARPLISERASYRPALQWRSERTSRPF